jgi:hypothetical protein
MCLQPSCAAFCREDQTTIDSQSRAKTLSYSTELLRLRPANHQPVSADSLYPPLPTEGCTTPRPFAKGIHCRNCGRLSTRYAYSESYFPTQASPRFKWEHYECSNCHVGSPDTAFRAAYNVTDSVYTRPLALCSVTRTSGFRSKTSNSTSTVWRRTPVRHKFD